jgi:hypothetical protein
MKTLPKIMATLVLVLFGALASGTAMAQHHGHGGVRFGISLGFPLYGPAYYPAPYYGYPYAYPAYGYAAPAYVYPPAAMVPYSSPTYAEQGVTQAAPSQAQGDWYYCAASRAYYPYVSECPAGWQRMPAQPPSR